MKLIELLEIIPDNHMVLIQDLDGNDLATYNGKDSIPKRFNEWKAVELTTDCLETGDPFWMVAIVIKIVP